MDNSFIFTLNQIRNLKMKAGKMNYSLLITVVFLFAYMLNINAQDWPRYLGPKGNGTSDQKGILRTWPANGPEVLWTTEVGRGFGGPVISKGKVYLLDRTDGVCDIMRCFDIINRERIMEIQL